MTWGSEMKGAVYYGKKKQILGLCSGRSSGGSSSRSSCGSHSHPSARLACRPLLDFQRKRQRFHVASFCFRTSCLSPLEIKLNLRVYQSVDVCFFSRSSISSTCCRQSMLRSTNWLSVASIQRLASAMRSWMLSVSTICPFSLWRVRTRVRWHNQLSCSIRQYRWIVLCP